MELSAKDSVTSISVTHRRTIFHAFWQLFERDVQMQYIKRHVTLGEVKRRKANPRNMRERNTIIHYTFTLDMNTIKVCKTFFPDTLDIAETMVRSAIQDVNSTAMNQRDERGKKTGPQKVSEFDKFNVRKHINMFDRVPSHYCRSDSSKEYLAKSLNIKELYRMYTAWCSEENITPIQIYFQQ